VPDLDQTPTVDGRCSRFLLAAGTQAKVVQRPPGAFVVADRLEEALDW